MAAFVTANVFDAVDAGDAGDVVEEAANDKDVNGLGLLLDAD